MVHFLNFPEILLLCVYFFMIQEVIMEDQIYLVLFETYTRSSSPGENVCFRFVLFYDISTIVCYLMQIPVD